MKTIIRETERGFLFRKGKFVRMLEPGVFHTFGSAEIRKVKLSEKLSDCFDHAQLSVLRKDTAFGASTVPLYVADDQIALHSVNGNFAEALTAGEYLFWDIAQNHSFVFHDTSQPYVPDTIPRHICEKLQEANLVSAVQVREHMKGLLYLNGKFEKVLDEGTYYFWSNAAAVSHDLLDTRLQQVTINGQEILTKDKVNIRLNFVCSYRITDFVKIRKEIRDYASQFYIAVQMTVREHIAALTLDEVLTQRETIAQSVLESLQAKAEAMHLEVTEAGIRDIILPGEIRDILNTVLIAEKRAQANVITRREEVASTRSLLNTAKLMEENKTLYKLKELEYLEKICENVGSISVSGGDLLEHLRAIIGNAS